MLNQYSRLVEGFYWNTSSECKDGGKVHLNAAYSRLGRIRRDEVKRSGFVR